MRYTRASVPTDKLYLASTAVLMSEAVKTLVCLVVVYTLLPSHERSSRKLYNFLYRELVINWRETVKLALPAILYLVQVICHTISYMEAHQNLE
jgi:UDP-sugar transporter A1/2/3